MADSCDPGAFIPIEEYEEVKHLKLCNKLVASLDDRVVGFIGIDADFIGWFYIHPEYFHQGIGRKLLSAGLKLVEEKAWIKESRMGSIQGENLAKN